MSMCACMSRHQRCIQTFSVRIHARLNVCRTCVLCHPHVCAYIGKCFFWKIATRASRSRSRSRSRTRSRDIYFSSVSCVLCMGVCLCIRGHTIFVRNNHDEACTSMRVHIHTHARGMHAQTHIHTYTRVRARTVSTNMHVWRHATLDCIKNTINYKTLCDVTYVFAQRNDPAVTLVPCITPWRNINALCHLAFEFWNSKERYRCMMTDMSVEILNLFMWKAVDMADACTRASWIMIYLLLCSK
jgi:hypothetical protein